jgi:hypothetical protein
MEIKDIKDESINVFEFGMVYNQACNWFSLHNPDLFRNHFPNLDIKENKSEMFQKVLNFYMFEMIKAQMNYKQKLEKKWK